MPTRISDIVEKQAFEQVEKLQTDLTELLATFNKTANGAALLNKAIMDGASYSEKAKNTTKATQALSEMEKMQRKIIDTQNKLNAAESLHGQILAEERVKLLEANQANKDFVKSKQVQAGSIEELRLKLKAAQQEYDRMAASERNAARGTEILTHIKKVDTELKALEFSSGRFQRNVGNYASGFSAIGNSISQLTREAPAFANSMQTGFMAISNNIPALTDAIKGIREQNNLLRAEGKPTESVLKQLGKAFFSWNTLISVGVTLLTVYGKEMVDFVGKMFEGSNAVSAMKMEQQALNEAYKDSSVKDAVKDIEELKINIKLAKDGMIDKEKVVKQYNESIGKTTGLVNSLDEAEKELVRNGDDYIQMMLYKAAATLALDKSAQSYLEGEQDRIELEKKLAELRKKQLSDNAEERGLQQFDEIALQSEINALQKRIEVRRKDSESLIQSLNAQADAIAKKNKWNIYGDNDKDAKLEEAGRKKAEREAEAAAKKLKSDKEKQAKEQIEVLKGIASEVAKMNEEERKDAVRTSEEIQKAKEKGQKAALETAIEYAEKVKAANIKAAKEELDLISENLEANQRMWDQADKERLDSQMKRLDTFREAVSLAESILSNIGGIIADQANARAERELKELDRVTDAQLAALDKVSMSATQKEEEKRRIEIQSEARRKQIERDKITDLRKAARLQKAADIASIISGTSVAIVNALKTQPTYVGIALAAGIAVNGGIQLARAYAAPLPQYAKGRKGGKEEWAELNEKGVELIESKDGKLSIANDGKRGVTFLKQGDKVHTHEDFMKMVENRTTVIPQYTSTSSDMYQRKQLEAVYDLQKEIKGLNNTMMRKKDGWKIEGTFAHDIRVESIRM